MNTNNCIEWDWRGESDRKRKCKNKQADLELREEKQQSKVFCEQRKNFGDCDR